MIFLGVKNLYTSNPKLDALRILKSKLTLTNNFITNKIPDIV